MALRTEQKEFLRLLESGRTITEAAKGIGRSRSIAWHWAKQDPEFAKRFNPYKGKNPAAQTPDLFSENDQPSSDIRDTAMRRLIREIESDGPASVLASAALLLCDRAIPTATKKPAVSKPEPLPPSESEQITAMLHRMFDVDANERPIAASVKQLTNMASRHSGNAFSVTQSSIGVVNEFLQKYFAKGRSRPGPHHAYCYWVPVPRKVTDPA